MFRILSSDKQFLCKPSECILNIRSKVIIFFFFIYFLCFFVADFPSVSQWNSLVHISVHTITNYPLPKSHLRIAFIAFKILWTEIDDLFHLEKKKISVIHTITKYTLFNVTLNLHIQIAFWISKNQNWWFCFIHFPTGFPIQRNVLCTIFLIHPT